MTAISEDFSMPNIQLKQLPSPLERAGITLTAISIATLATHFFSTYIPITPIQNFVRNIHKIPYMPPVITILSSTLGAIGIAGIIKSYISKPPTKEQTNFLSPDSSEEAIRQDLIAIFSNKRILTENGTEIELFKMPLFTYYLIDDPGAISSQHNLDKPRVNTKLNIDGITYDSTRPDDDSFDKQFSSLPNEIKLACTQTYNNALFKLLNSWFNKYQENTFVLLQHTSVEELLPAHLINKIDDDNYQIQNNIYITGIDNPLKDGITAKRFKKPIPLKISIDVTKTQSGWITKNIQIHCI